MTMMETNAEIYPRFIKRDNPSGKRKERKPLAGVPYMSPAALKEEYTRLMEEANARGGKPVLYRPNGDPRVSIGDPAIKTVHWTNFKLPVVTEEDIAHLKFLNQKYSGSTTPRPAAAAAAAAPRPSPEMEKRFSSFWSIRKVKPAHSTPLYLLSDEERIPIMKARLAELAAKYKAEAEAAPPPIRIWNGMSSQERQEAEALLEAASYKRRIRRKGMSSSQEPEDAELAAAAGIQAQVEGGVSVLEHPRS